MWSNPKWPADVVEANLRRRPPYCPNSSCSWHDPDLSRRQGFFKVHAKRKIQRFPYISVRFRRQRRRRTFSDSFFTFSYRDRRPETYEQIFDLLSRGWTKMDTAHFLGHSLDTVLRRTRKLART